MKRRILERQAVIPRPRPHLHVVKDQPLQLPKQGTRFDGTLAIALVLILAGVALAAVGAGFGVWSWL